MNNKLIALLLWLFLGFTGITEFYLNKPGRGVAMLFMFLFSVFTAGFGFFLTGIPMLVLWFITLGDIININ